MIKTGGGGGGGAGILLMLTKPCSINLRQIPPSFLKFRIPTFDSRHCNIHLRTSKTSTAICCSRWDSNAETVGSRNFGGRNKKGNRNEDVEREEEEEAGRGASSRSKGKKRRWWSDKPDYMEEDEEDEEEEGGILDDAIGNLWILKVFRSYGWTLPPIILSLLLNSGPKAFLTVFSLFFGQSVVTFAFEKLFGRPKKKRRKRRKKPYASRSTRSNPEMDDDGEKLEENQETVKGKMGFESWVPSDNGYAGKDDGQPRGRGRRGEGRRGVDVAATWCHVSYFE